MAAATTSNAEEVDTNGIWGLSRVKKKDGSRGNTTGGLGGTIDA